MTDHQELYVGGEWVRPAGQERLTVRSASTEAIIGSVPAASAADADAAVRAARAVCTDPGGWSAWPPARRADVLDRFADELDRRAEDIITAICRQNGMPLAIARQIEAGSAARLLRYYARLIRELPIEETRPGLLVKETLVRRRPIGVVAAILPWNVPQTLMFAKVAPALAAGCPIIVKPSPETVLDAYLVAEAAEAAGIPRGVLSILPGGRELGAYLVSHPEVDRVAFTGSTEGGRAVAEACARLLRPVSLELGGKSAAIVLDDADLEPDEVRADLFAATLANSGQVCFLGTRVLAPRSRYAEVVELFEQILKSAPVGDPLDERTLIGPMVSARQRDRVQGYIEAGRADGARVVVGGDRVSGPGWFVQPTLFADVDNSARIAQEEIFGPVLSVIPYDADDDAVRIANDSQYGLGGTVWSGDPERALAVASRVQTGTIGINGYAPEPTAPFGGVKASGIGREYGPEGLASYQ
ncbi:aldehyde dehydrogenase family protein [Kribbella solani]|uniref:Acyl-CoA reductase-like NAD-dependent aldehyde dehydrogenase n=1 Tax=Kribbella solani TaxID=236067 RepID=A0A841DI08_9ACTN|nr:acyl-CoA reductase-like NAD-dependent aldehyde dehydrogenase [Kribbella solani]